MEPTKEFIDALYRDDVLAARRTPRWQKLLSGPELFEGVCLTMLDGIRSQFPGVTEDEAQRILRQRLDLVRRLRDIPLPKISDVA